jgi:hypothetical protein
VWEARALSTAARLRPHERVAVGQWVGRAYRGRRHGRCAAQRSMRIAVATSPMRPVCPFLPLCSL